MAKWDKECLRLFEGGSSYNEIAKTMGLSWKQVNHALTRARKARKGNIEYEDKRSEPTEAEISQLYSALINLDTAISNTDTKQTKTTFRIDDNKPIGICHWGDWHFYCRGGDYKQFDKDKKAILDTEGLYFIGMGDYKDNHLPTVHPNGVFEQIATPGIQDLLVKSIFEEVGEKCIAIIRGCHDDWDKRMGDKDFVATLCSASNAVNLWHGGGLNLKLGDQAYKIRARHKYKFESGLNTTNSQRRLLDMFGPADVIAVAHKHFPDFQTLDRMGQKVVYLRSGSYKAYDELGQKLAGYVGHWGVPMCVYYPDKHKITPFPDLYEGITYLNAVRGQY